MVATRMVPVRAALLLLHPPAARRRRDIVAADPYALGRGLAVVLLPGHVAAAAPAASAPIDVVAVGPIRSEFGIILVFVVLVGQEISFRIRNGKVSKHILSG